MRFVCGLVVGVLLVCSMLALGQPAVPASRECWSRSSDGCLCGVESQVVEWRTKALASDIFWERGGCPESPGVVATTGSCGLGSAVVFGIVEVIKAVR